MVPFSHNVGGAAERGDKVEGPTALARVKIGAANTRWPPDIIAYYWIL
jgi:hypothetical protein